MNNNIIYKVFLGIMLFCMIVNIKVYGYENKDISILKEKYNVKQYSISCINKENIEHLHNEQYKNNEKYELASNGKMVAAYICMKLKEEGKLDFDEKIINYLDKKDILNDSRFKEITVREILCHSAGFSPNYEIIIDKKIYYNPGSRFSYSGVGYIYLQKVIENMTKMSFEEAAKYYVFNPLNMKESTFEKAETITPYMNGFKLCIYIIGIFIIFYLIVFCILVVIFFTKHTLKIETVFKISLLLSIIVSVIFILNIAQRLVMPAIIFYLGLIVIIYIPVKKKIYNYIWEGVYISTILLISFSCRFQVPIGQMIINKDANVAYSLISTHNDMEKFVVNLIKEYNNCNKLVSEMVEPQIQINVNNSWGLGAGIYENNNGKIVWHSGINFGMHSLIAINFEKESAVIILTNSDEGLGFAKEFANKKLHTDCEYNIPVNIH